MRLCCKSWPSGTILAPPLSKVLGDATWVAATFPIASPRICLLHRTSGVADIYSPVIRTLNLLISNQDLISLEVYFPGIDGGDIWDLPNANIYFAEEIFSNSTINVHACIPKALAKMVGIMRLVIGYTRDIGLAETIAREAGAKELVIRTCPEGQTLNLSNEEKAMWIDKGWWLKGQMACKTLVEETPGEEEGRVQSKAELQRDISYEGYSEGGRLKADMEVDI